MINYGEEYIKKKKKYTDRYISNESKLRKTIICKIITIWLFQIFERISVSLKKPRKRNLIYYNNYSIKVYYSICLFFYTIA